MSETFKWVTKMVIALDLGSETGYAIHSNRGVEHGVIDFKSKGKFTEQGYADLWRWLTSHVPLALSINEVELALEMPHAGRFYNAQKILFGLVGVVKAFARMSGMKVTEYKPKEIKKYWTGSGNADKTEMVSFTKILYPKVKNHNESDAIALLHLHNSKYKIKINKGR